MLADHAAAAGSVTDLLREADRLAWLTNWPAARPLFTRAEAESRTTHDARHARYAKFGRLRGDMQTVKGDIDLEWDIVAAQQGWQQVRALARELPFGEAEPPARVAPTPHVS